MNGKEAECFKVITEFGVYWFPKDSSNNLRIHPMASHEVIQDAIEILQSAPEHLEIVSFQWEERIDEVKLVVTAVSIRAKIRAYLRESIS